jgi:hypothetical protein
MHAAWQCLALLIVGIALSLLLDISSSWILGALLCFCFLVGAHFLLSFLSATFSRCLRFIRSVVPGFSRIEQVAQAVTVEFIGENQGSKDARSPRRRVRRSSHRQPLRRRAHSSQGTYEPVEEIGTDEDDDDEFNHLEKHFTGPREFGRLCAVDTVTLGGTAGGHGVIALEPIAAGTTIFQDRPLLLCPAEYDGHPEVQTMERKLWALLVALLSPEHRTIRDTIEWEVGVNEELLDIVWEPEKEGLDVVTKEIGREHRLGASVKTQAHRTKQLYGRLHTNSIMSEPHVQPPWAMIGRRLAMLNHSCVPNAEVVLPKQCSHGCQCPVIQVRAIAPINTGEAVTILYYSPPAAALGEGQRREAGKGSAYLRDIYGFECKCRLCTAEKVQQRRIAKEEGRSAEVETESRTRANAPLEGHVTEAEWPSRLL